MKLPLLLVLLNTALVCATRTSVPADIVRRLRDEHFYDKHATPSQDLDTPTIVNISMYIEGMSSFRAQTMDFHVDIYFQETWLDRRLKHNQSQRILIKDLALFDLMCFGHPDVYFANARVSTFHEVTSPNFLVWIHPNGTVYYDCRISLTVMCMQDLAKYPLDGQSCILRILSYAYDVEQMQIRWIGDSHTAIEKNGDIKMADMHLLEIKAGLRNDTYTAGVWSCATAEFFVQREIMHHFLQSYVPTGLIVVISWFSFWLDVDAVPGRVSLSITTLLTLATQASAARLALPEVSYIKAIDVWMGTCMGFVFGVMIEFTFINYWTRRKEPLFEKRNRTENHYYENAVSAALDPRLNEMNGGFSRLYGYSVPGRRFVQSPTSMGGNFSPTWSHDSTTNAESDADERCVLRRTADEKRRRPSPSTRSGGGARQSLRQKLSAQRAKLRLHNRKVAQSIDETSRWLFPLTFTVFNIVYWIYYLYIA